MQEAIRRIRQNALQFTVTEYSRILEDNLITIDETKKKFSGYREHVRKLVDNLEQQDIHVEKLEQREADNLKNLKIIEGYINRALDEYQRILSTHFDLKSMYTKELEALSQMSLIKRFSLRNELYQPVMKDPSLLDRLDTFMRPLFLRELDKTYYIGKAFEYQKTIKAREVEEAEDLEDFDDEAWRAEQKKKLEEKLRVYKDCLYCILRYSDQYQRISLRQMKDNLTEEDRKSLLPNLEVFREIMVELIKNKEFTIDTLRKEKNEHFAEQVKDFQVNLCLLEVIEEHENLKRLKRLKVTKESDEIVEFLNVVNESGQLKKIRCSNVIFQVV